MVRAARHPDESNRLITTRPPLERYEYTYDNASDIDKRLDKRTRNRTGPDEDYAYDGLNRLTEAVRGSDGSPFTAAGTRSQQWTYDALGNQVETITDTQAATGTFTSDTDLTYARVFNKVNEATSADTTESQGTPVTITQAYDDAGNHTADGDDAFTYDAWNRLVKVEVGGTPVDRAVYTYYPLHQRATRKADDDLSEDAGSPGSPRLETWTRYYYDASWRLLEERVHVADAYADDEWSEIPLAKIVQRIWGLTYIDEFCAMVTDTDSGSPDGDLTTGSPERLFALHDRKFDVTALYNPALGAGLRVVERVRYSAYGVARHMPSGDVNGDGAVDGTDLAVLLANWNKTYLNAGVVDTSFPADLDLNGDNTISGSDQAALLTRYASARPEGALSTKGNTVGYAGYLYDEAVDKSCVRFRWYDAEQGNWWTRDPFGTTLLTTALSPYDIRSFNHELQYLGGSSLYQYVNSAATNSIDPLGLIEPAGPSLIPDWYFVPLEVYFCPMSRYDRIQEDFCGRLSERAQGLVDQINDLWDEADDAFNTIVRQGKINGYGMMFATAGLSSFAGTKLAKAISSGPSFLTRLLYQRGVKYGTAGGAKFAQRELERLGYETGRGILSTGTLPATIAGAYAGNDLANRYMRSVFRSAFRWYSHYDQKTKPLLERLQSVYSKMSEIDCANRFNIVPPRL